MKKNTRYKDEGTSNQITEGVIWKQLLLFFFPILFGTFFQQLYNTADAVIVGRFVGKEALAAVGGPTGTIINLFVGFFIGLSSGAGVIISQYFGAGQKRQLSHAVHTAMAFSAVCGFFIMIIGILLAPFALEAMDTPADILPYGVLYMRIYFLGVIPNLVYNMGAGILRAIGDSRRPLYFLIASCFTNIILDILLVVYFDMGVMGAAIATILSQLLSAILVLIVLMRSRQAYRLMLSSLKLDRDMLMRIIRIGFPAGLQSVMYTSSNIIIQSSVNVLGTDTVAAWTAYGKIDTLFWMMISAFGISITTFVGQNYGAKKSDRVYKGIRVCLGMCVLSSIVLSFLLYTFGSLVFLLFTTDQAVIAKGTQILRYLVPAFITYVCVEIYSGALRGAGDCWIPMILTSLGVCVLRIVWICTAVPIHPVIETVVFCYPLTWTVTSILFLIYFHWFSKLKRSRLKGNY
ncbi:MATE family efflux transporter [Clostridium boliviensis]|uniref:Probable multidrug resistance protein NorM n=1 Tax=Clostridium boliviensis TaxID=318465 RepID=A0ABU4GEF2_9CLOT|nr:MATE family efflux transporter [Clostridium boliviensis]MDW2795992.1 MATE family efflux transporter [Clostridium boliviensis]